MPKQRALVVGNVGLETSLKLGTFPLPDASSYQPHNLELSVSGVGFNLARALQTLGTDVRLASVIGPDTVGHFVRAELQRVIDTSHIHIGKRTARSLVVSDAAGTRHVHTDLGGVSGADYPLEHFDAALKGCALALLSNIEYARPLLGRAHAAGVPIATDLHAIRDLQNPYDQDFLAAATLLFFSGERLEKPYQTVSELRRRFSPEIIVVGLGAHGALLSERGRETLQVPAFAVSQVVSTVGAGDALQAAFSHFWLQGEAPESALHLASAFAAQKIRTGQGGTGFVSEADVRRVVTASRKPKR